MAQREAKVAIVPVQNHEPGTAHETAGGDQNLIICSLLVLLLLNSRIDNHLRLKMLRWRLLVHLVVPLLLLILGRRRMMHYGLRRSRIRSRLGNLLLLQRGTPHGRNRRTSSTTWTHFGHRYEVQRRISSYKRFPRESFFSVE